MHRCHLASAHLGLLISAFLIGVPTISAIELELFVVDSLGAPLPARVHLRDSLGHAWPDSADSALMSHGPLESYFYMPGSVTAQLAPGPTKITIGHGFEWVPVDIEPDLQTDTTLVVTLESIIDLRSRGWICADPHIHSHHEPIDYPVGPERVFLLGQCEDLEQIWCLDQEYEFTAGLPHAVSTPELAICYTIEYRNLAYGHVALLGLRELMGSWCCGPENWPAFPMLSDLREQWDPQEGEALVLAHPQTGADFFDDNFWPAGGLGRELPVLAALGHLDALDLAAYSNNPNFFIDDWYRLLSCGLKIPPSVGTDAVVAQYMTRPAGGYRVYAYEGAGSTHTPDAWVEAVKAGRTFVTNYPLIPTFTVNGVGAGETIELLGPLAQIAVHLQVVSALPVDVARIMANGRLLHEISIQGTSIDTTVTVTLEESSWLALHVLGTAEIVHAVSPQLHAHTAPVYVHLGGEPSRIVSAAGYFLDWIDNLQLFVEARGNWEQYADYLHVLERLNAAREFFGSLYRIAPDPFALLMPAEGATLYLYGGPLHFEWEAATDPEAGDRVQYHYDVSADSIFTDPISLAPTTGTTLDLEEMPLAPEQTYWWRIRAEDAGGNVRVSSPAARSFFLSATPWAQAPEHPPTPVPFTECRLTIWPNPARGPVWFSLTPAPSEPFYAEVLDAEGRRLESVWLGRSAVGGAAGLHSYARGIYRWNGEDRRGHPLPTGCYWIRLTSGDAALTKPVMILR